MNTDKKSESSRSRSERYLAAVLLLLVIATLLICFIAYRSSSNVRQSSSMIYAAPEYPYATDEDGMVPDIEYSNMDLLEKKDVVHISDSEPVPDTIVLEDSDGHISYQVTVDYPFEYEGTTYYAYKEYVIPEADLPYKTTFQVVYDGKDIATVFVTIDKDEDGRIEKNIETFAAPRAAAEMTLPEVTASEEDTAAAGTEITAVAVMDESERNYEITIDPEDGPKEMTFSMTVTYEYYPWEKFATEP